MKDFEILKELGKGSYGTVFLVKKKLPQDATVFASTKMSTGDLGQPTYYVMKKIQMKDVKIKQQLSAVKEAKIMSELEDHPNLIKYHTSFMENDNLHILMEYANRGDLYKVSFEFYHFSYRF